MALTIKTPLGFKQVGTTSRNHLFALPGDPGTTYTKDHRYILSGGVLSAATNSHAGAIFTCKRTVTCPAASQPFPRPGVAYDISKSSTQNDTLVICSVDIPEGLEIYAAPLKNHKDETLAAVNTATRSIGLTTGLATDDYGIGALVYTYEGPTAGELNIIEDYDHADGNVDKEVITHRAYIGTPTTSTKVIILSGGGAASDGVTLFGRLDLTDEDELDVSDGYDDGDYTVYAGWKEITQWLPDGWVPVVRSAAFHMA